MAAKKIQNNYKLLVVTVLFVVALSLGIYFLKQNTVVNTHPSPSAYPQIDTVNDGVYTNYQYGFRFKYPKNYKLTGPANRIQILSPNDPLRTRERTFNDDKELEMEIVVKNYVASDNLNIFTDEVVKSNEEITPLISKELITVGGVKSYHLKFSTAEMYTLMHANFRILISKFPLKTDRQAESDAIIKSLEFFDPSNPLQK